MDDTLDRVRAILRTTPERWVRVIQALTLDSMNQAPAPGQWSATECLQHLVDTETIFTQRLEAFKQGQDFPAFNPDKEGTKQPGRSPAELAEAFALQRGKNMRALDALTPADLDRQAKHAELGPVTLRQMVNEWAAHDLNHTVQAEEALMQPFIRECGPWQKYFTTHTIGG